MRRKLLLQISVLMFVLTSLITGQDVFVRSDLITPPSTYPSGFGATISGVDLDGDGKLEIYSVDGMTDFMTGDEIPQIIKYEKNGSSWDSVWAASFPNERQNTWAALTIGDLDGDGKQEIIWGFTNNFAVNTTPPRIVVFETNGDDVLGISDGAGNFTPNAQWNLDLAPSTNVRPLKWFANDIDGDGVQEVIFADRQGTLSMGVISVTDIPDAGGATETWTLEMTNQTELVNRFARTNVIDGPDGGFGGVVTGMDYDADGLMDLYAVNDNWNDGANGELVPTLYKYELVSGAWVLRWSTQIPGIDFQNTWPALTSGDWDGDGKGEIQWCPVNNFGPNSENPDPDRIVVYETPGDGSDVMGVDNGDGKYKPNAGWNMDLPASTNMRPYRGVLVDIDNDSKLEFVFTERTNYYVWGVIGVSDIPDNADGSETWTFEGKGSAETGNDYRDIAVIDQTIYLFNSSGKVRTITNDGTTYTVSDPYQAYPGWSWLSAITTDIDGDGTVEIVTGDYRSGGTASVWVLVADADTLVGHKIADFSANTAKQITNVRVGDINADSLKDFVVGFRGTDEVYRVAYNGGDILSESSYATSLLDKGVLGAEGIGQMDIITVANIDGVAGEEVLYTGIPRSITANTAPLTVGKYADVVKLDPGSRWDLTIANNAIHLIDGSGNLQRVDYSDGQWNIYPAQKAIVNGAFLTASTTDVDGDGVEEIMIGNWSDAKVNMLKWMNGAWVATVVADFTADGGTRLNGGAVGDIDNDGFIDFVTGSRASSPNGQIYRVEYTGGDMMDADNWKGSVIDYGLNDKFTQYEVINIANLDDDADMEVLYTTDYARGSNTAADAPFPLVILDIVKVQTTPIAEVKIDADGDFVPDNVGATYTIIGVVISVNYTATSNRFSYYIQDETGAINITKGSETGGGPVYEIGQRLQATGKLGHYRGTAQLEMTDLAADLVDMGIATPVQATLITMDQYLSNPEKYESSLIEIKNVAKTAASVAWPAADSDANMTIWDGYKELVLRIDKDTDLDNNPEPAYPMNVIGVATQYTSASTVYNDGYQITPNSYSKITPGVKAPPSPYFFLQTPEDNAVITLNNPGDTFTATWTPSVDLNNDVVIYQFAFLPNKKDTITNDPTVTFKASSITKMMAGADTLTLDWTVRTKGSEAAIIASVDTFTVTFINKIIVGVEQEELLPKEFYVDQNYPNPFNPATTIRFGLPEAANVELKIYNIIGQEVAVLINNQTLNAGTHNVVFNASSLASGTYIYKLNAGNKTEIKKMLLLK